MYIVKFLLFVLMATRLNAGSPPPCAQKGGCPDELDALCQPPSNKPNWPIFHLMDNVSRMRDGRLQVEGLNDMNAIFQYKGLYHVMNQAGGGDWTNAVSNDLVHWFHLKHALDPTVPSKGFPHNWGGPCDGSLSFPDLGDGVYNGSTPVIMYGPDCRCTRERAKATGCGRYTDIVPSSADGADGADGADVGTGDAARMELARPANPGSDLYLEDWVKVSPGPVTFSGLPCSFPGRIWKSKNVMDGGKPYWNQICAFNGTRPWARYITTDKTLMNWRAAPGAAGEAFVIGIPPTDSNNSECYGASLFHRIPGIKSASTTPSTSTTAGAIDAADAADADADAGADVAPTPTHMISANSGSQFYVGTFNETTEMLTVVGKRQTLDSSTNYQWAAAGTMGPDPVHDNTGRMLTVAWVRGGGSGRLPCITLDCPSVVSLVRSVSWDAQSKQLVSFPVQEYELLRNHTFVEGSSFTLVEGSGLVGAVKQASSKSLPIPAGTGSVDILASFELVDGASMFGVSVRSGTVKVEVVSVVANVKGGGFSVLVNFYAGPQPCISKRGAPPCTTPPMTPPPTNVTVPVLAGETLDFRVLVDRPIVEMFVQNGRAAFVSADANFTIDKTEVAVFNNGSKAVAAVNVSAYEMGCGWAKSKPAPAY